MEKPKSKGDILAERIQTYAVSGLHLFAVIALVALNSILVLVTFVPEKYAEKCFNGAFLLFEVGVAGFVLALILYRPRDKS